MGAVASAAGVHRLAHSACGTSYQGGQPAAVGAGASGRYEVGLDQARPHVIPRAERVDRDVVLEGIGLDDDRGVEGLDEVDGGPEDVTPEQRLLVIRRDMGARPAHGECVLIQRGNRWV